MISECPRADRWRSSRARRDHDAGSRLYQGWKVVACAFLIAVFGWGFGFYGIGVFLAELVDRHGWATSSVASAVTVLYLVGAALIACIGNAFERFGPRRVVLAGMMWRLLAPGAVYEYWRQPRFEELGNAARFSLDENFRGKVYAEMTQIVLENFPWIPVLQANDSYGLQRYVDWKPYPNQQIELRAFNFRFRQA